MEQQELKDTLVAILKRLDSLETAEKQRKEEQTGQQPVIDNGQNVNNQNQNGSTNQSTTLGAESALPLNYSKEFDQIRERLAKVSLPSELKVNDNSQGIKNECRPTLKVISKSARFAETNLKQLSLISARLQGTEQNKTVEVTEQELEALFTISTANIQFVQAEYANIVVKNSFDEETARLFKAFENHSSAFPDSSLNSLRVAAELSAARDRTQVQRGRGANRSQRFNNGRWMTRGRGRSDSGRFNQDWQYHSRFPNNYNNNNSNE